METTEKKLSKHILAACNNLEKQIQSYYKKRAVQVKKAGEAKVQDEIIDVQIGSLQEQIKRLKGE